MQDLFNSFLSFMAKFQDQCAELSVEACPGCEFKDICKDFGPIEDKLRARIEERRSHEPQTAN